MDSKSIYRAAGKLGIPTGAYLSVLSAAVVFSDRASFIPVVALALMMCLPFVIYRIQRSAHKADPTTPYAGIWLLGMMTLIFGSLICALVTYVVITAMRPDFINEQVQAAINLYSQTPELRDSTMVQTMRMAMEEGLLPTPIEYVVQMFWMTSFAGSLLSALLAVPATRLPLRNNGL